jgi:hypothetical protein
MKPILAAVPALLLFTASAFAQEVPEASTKDLWCGIAFGVIVSNVPADLNEQQQANVKRFADGGVMLVDRAKAAHLENGFTEETFATHLTTLTPEVTAQVTTTDSTVQAAYSFEECQALLPAA